MFEKIPRSGDTGRGGVIDVAGWYGVHPRSVGRRTEANEHRDGAHHPSECVVPGRTDDRTRLQYGKHGPDTAKKVQILASCVSLKPNPTEPVPHPVTSP